MRVCRFFGGGGDGVNHGDFDSSPPAPSKILPHNEWEQQHTPEAIDMAVVNV
jgi:hypothetical protein